MTKTNKLQWNEALVSKGGKFRIQTAMTKPLNGKYNKVGYGAENQDGKVVWFATLEEAKALCESQA